MSNFLEIRELTVKYITDQGKAEVLDEVNLIIKKGSTRGIIGESGCGKTTLAKSILSILPSSTTEIEKGEILFQGEDLLKKSEKELSVAIRGRAIALIPQNPSESLNPVFTIGTQIRDVFRRKHLSGVSPQDRMDNERIERMIIEKITQVQLPNAAGLLRRYPHELSGGQKQRITIAMALLLNPVLLILDEPTTALDVTVEAEILLLLSSLVKENNTSTLYITHDLAVASNMCDFVTVMYCGQVVESAPNDSFFLKPFHPYSCKLVECLPKPGRQLKEIPGRVPSLIKPPKGCRFHPRCDRKVQQCSETKPPENRIGADHWVRCYNPVI